MFNKYSLAHKRYIKKKKTTKSKQLQICFAYFVVFNLQNFQNSMLILYQFYFLNNYKNCKTSK